MKTLQEAIDAVETNQRVLVGADGALTAAQDKLTAAQAGMQAATSDEAAAVAAYNASIDELIAVATAAKRS